MKAKDFLQQVALAEKRMQKAQQKVDLYRSLAEKVHASMDGERVSKTRNVTAHEEHMIRLIEAKEQLPLLPVTLKLMNYTIFFFRMNEYSVKFHRRDFSWKISSLSDSIPITRKKSRHGTS